MTDEFLLELIFEKKFSNENYEKINLEKIISRGSSELCLPLIFSKICERNLNRYFEKEFVDYLQKISELNNERNKSLIQEVKNISKILKQNKVNHVFLKGSAQIFSEIYNNNFERMIGDIDLLIDRKDIQKGVDLLMEDDYEFLESDNYFDEEDRHLRRLVNKDKVFAIEIHRKLFTNKYFSEINENKLLKNKIICNNIFVPSLNNQLYHCIYNHQINDYGNLYMNFSIRTSYDFFKILKKTDIDLNLSKHRFHEIKNFLNLLIIYKPFEINYKFMKKSLKTIYVSIKKRNILISRIHQFLVKILIFIKIKFKQVKKIFLRKNYRKWLYDLAKKKLSF